MGSALPEIKSRIYFDTLETRSHDQVGELEDYQIVAYEALIKKIDSKYVDDKCSDADAKAIQKFLQMNDHCASINYKAKKASTECKEIERLFYAAIEKAVKPFDPVYGFTNCILEYEQDLYDHVRMGPGSSVGSDGSNFYVKAFASKDLLASSEFILAVTNRFLERNVTWSEAFEKRLDLGFNNIGIGCAKLSVVPKKNDISRTIVIEPALNTFWQLAVGELLKDRVLMRYNIAIDDQQCYNSILAHRGSLTNQFATIDLQSASDCVSIALIDRFFPKSVAKRLKDFSSREVTMPDGGSEVLHMISTMGNGKTFPLQTLIFCCVVEAVYGFLGLPLVRNNRRLKEPGNFAVFGDDIIVTKAAASDVLMFLSYLGFFPNLDKTYVDGPFRESCGYDFYKGHNVRPVFIKRLETTQDLFSAFNNLMDWSVRNKLPLPRTLAYIRSLINPKDLLFVPYSWDSSGGIRVPECYGRKTYDINGSRVFKFLATEQNSVKVISNGNHITLQFNLDYKIKLPKNDVGFYLAFLGGYISDSSLTFKPKKVRTKVVVGCVPNWFSRPVIFNNEHHLFLGLSYTRFREYFYSVNFFSDGVSAINR